MLHRAAIQVYHEEFCKRAAGETKETFYVLRRAWIKRVDMIVRLYGTRAAKKQAEDDAATYNFQGVVCSHIVSVQSRKGARIFIGQYKTGHKTILCELAAQRQQGTPPHVHENHISKARALFPPPMQLSNIFVIFLYSNDGMLYKKKKLCYVL